MRIAIVKLVWARRRRLRSWAKDLATQTFHHERRVAEHHRAAPRFRIKHHRGSEPRRPPAEEHTRLTVVAVDGPANGLIAFKKRRRMSGSQHCREGFLQR